MMLGERIRTLRKQKKMTLEALAGDKLTKGMLSQIENNKAKPSMESLEYIAERLGVAVTELLEKVSSAEIRKVLEEAEHLHEDFLLYRRKLDDTIQKCIKLVQLIEPYISNLNESYESARLMEIYSKALFCLDQEEWKIYCYKAASLYDSLNLTANRSEIGIFKCMTLFVERRYEEALQAYLIEIKHIETNHIKIDPMTQVSIDYNIAAVYSALGDIKTTSEAVDRALEYSRKEKLYYKTNDIYQLAAVVALSVEDEKKFHYYLKKLQQYGEFVEDPLFAELCDILRAEYLLHVKGKYEEAMPLIDRYLTFDETTQKITGDNWNMLLKGKALYFIKEYEKALAILQTIYIPEYISHPIDLALNYIKDTFIALCFKELHNEKEARHYAKIAYDNFLPLPHSIFRKLSIETYESML